MDIFINMKIPIHFLLSHLQVWIPSSKGIDYRPWEIAFNIKFDTATYSSLLLSSVPVVEIPNWKIYWFKSRGLWLHIGGWNFV